MSSKRPSSNQRGKGGKAQDSPSNHGRSAGATLDKPITVSLQHGRARHVIWLLVCALLGALLVFKFGTIGKWIGIGLLLLAAHHGRRIVMTMLHPAGDLEIGLEEVSLPRGLCRGNPVTFGIDAVKHAYLLRRAIPWTTTGPVLVVEAGDKIHSYPRDWFPSDSDQRRVALTINRRLGRIED